MNEKTQTLATAMAGLQIATEFLMHHLDHETLDITAMMFAKVIGTLGEDLGINDEEFEQAMQHGQQLQLMLEFRE